MLIQANNPDKAKQFNENFTIWTYQYLENLLLNNQYIQSFDLIICDEIHYFLTDSIFNSNTQLSYDFIFHHQNNILKLLLTATPHGIMDYITKIGMKPLKQKENNPSEITIDGNVYIEISELDLPTLKRKGVHGNGKISMTINNKSKKIVIDGNIYNLIDKNKELTQENLKSFSPISATIKGTASLPDNKILINDESLMNNNTDKFEVNEHSYYYHHENINNYTRSKNRKINKPKPVTLHTYELYNNYDYLNIKYITQEKEIVEIVQHSKEKNIIFVSSKKHGQDIKEELSGKDIKSIFITSDNKNAESKENVAELVSANTFSEKVLITTSVLDVGVNFLDEEIENIIIAATEPTEFLQMLGRIRVIQEEQEISLFIYSRTAQYFKNLRDEYVCPKIKCIEFLELYPDLEEIFKEKISSNDNIPDEYETFLYKDHWHNNKIAFNTLAAYRYRELYKLYNEIYNGIKQDEDYFIKKQLEWLGLQETFSIQNFYSDEIQKIRIKKLQEAIEEEIEKMDKMDKNNMYKDECEKIMNKFKFIVRTLNEEVLRSNEKLSIKKFNWVCKVYNIPYCIAQRQEKIDGKRRNKYYLIKSDDNIINELKLEINL